MDGDWPLSMRGLNRRRPSLAFIYGLWERFEPRAPENQTDVDLREFALWLAKECDGLETADVEATFGFIPIIRERAK